MKKIIVAFLAVGLVPSMMAQGSFNAANTPDGATVGTQGQVFVDPGTGLRLAQGSDNVQVSVYWGIQGTPESGLALANLSGDFGGGPAQGPVFDNGLYFIGTVQTQNPAAGAGPNPILVQLRGVYDGVEGRSSIFSQTVAYGTDLTPDMAASGDWAIVVPEPTTFALAGLGAAALLIFRRRD